MEHEQPWVPAGFWCSPADEPGYIEELLGSSVSGEVIPPSSGGCECVWSYGRELSRAENLAQLEAVTGGPRAVPSVVATM